MNRLEPLCCCRLKSNGASKEGTGISKAMVIRFCCYFLMYLFNSAVGIEPGCGSCKGSCGKLKYAASESLLFRQVTAGVGGSAEKLTAPGGGGGTALCPPMSFLQIGKPQGSMTSLRFKTDNGRENSHLL